MAKPFIDDLQAKAYALVNGSIDLDEFKSWYRLAIVTQPAAPAAAGGEAAFIPPPKTERFNDYARDIDEPDEETRAHHKRLLGSGSED